MSNALQLPKVSYDVIKLQGGYDLLTPTLSLQPGAVREALNFEVSVNGGYTRIGGYERFDGQTSPSTAAFNSLTLSSTTNLAVGNVIHGADAYATVIAIVGTSVYFTKKTGTFVLNESITVGATTIGTVTALTGAVPDARTNAQYTALAAAVYRSDIDPVPGSGAIRGVANYQGVVYAWRNNTAGTAMNIYRSTSSGWEQVDLGRELAFDGGTNEIKEGDTITGGTSSATATVERVLVRSGTWAANDAAGTLILSSVSGTFVNNDVLSVGATTCADATGADAAITLLPSGRVQAVVGSFGSQYGTRIYGCDGVNPGFEFDGQVYAPIRTGMATDTPDNVAIHTNHLFFSFNSSLQFSSINEPFRWDPIFGAGEIAMKNDITGLQIVAGSNASPALIVYSQNETSVLYGTSEADFQLTNYSSTVGANRYTSQRLDTVYSFDDRGVTSLETTNKFGNFDSATLTYNIRPFVQSRRTNTKAAGLNREKSQYRLFFGDGYALYMTVVNGQYMGSMPVQFPHTVECWCEGAASDGIEKSYFGSTNGYVYQMDVGTSFDGQNIQYNLLLNYNAVGSPRIRKRYRRASIEVTGDAYAEFSFGYSLAYGSAYTEQPTERTYASEFSTSSWDTFVWDTFIWDGRTLAPSEVEMSGTGENVALQIAGDYNFISEFTLNSVIVHYSMRRGMR